MSPALANFLFEVVNFVLLAMALSWVLFRPVRAALDAERERHARTQRELDQRRHEAEALAEEARALRARVEGEMERSRIAVLATARAEAARIQEEARQAQAEDRQAMLRELTATGAAEAEALYDTVARIAADSVRRLLGVLDGPPLDLALVRLACAEVSALPAAARIKAVVEAARPLEAEARRLLAEALGAEFEERVLPELGAGVRITTTAGQVDASAVALAHQAARAVVALRADRAA